MKLRSSKNKLLVFVSFLFLFIFAACNLTSASQEQNKNHHIYVYINRSLVSGGNRIVFSPGSLFPFNTRSIHVFYAIVVVVGGGVFEPFL